MDKDKIITLLVILALVLGVLNLYQFWNYRNFQLSYSESGAVVTPTFNQAPTGKYTFNFNQVEALGGAVGKGSLQSGALGCGAAGEVTKVQGSGTLEVNFWGSYSGSNYPAVLTIYNGTTLVSQLALNQMTSITSGSNYLITGQFISQFSGSSVEAATAGVIVLTVPVSGAGTGKMFTASTAVYAAASKARAKVFSVVPLTNAVYSGIASANSKSAAWVATAQAAAATPPPINQAPLGQYGGQFNQSLVTVGGGAGATTGAGGVAAGCIGGTVVSQPGGTMGARIDNWTQEGATQSSYGTVAFSGVSFPVYWATSITVKDYYIIALASKEMYVGVDGVTVTAGGVMILVMPTAAGGVGSGEMFGSAVVSGSFAVNPSPEGGATPNVSAIIKTAAGGAILTPIQNVKGPY